MYSKKMWCSALVTLSLIVIGCSSSNRLRDYDFRDHTASSFLLIPRHGDVKTDSFVDIDTKDPIRTALSVGSTVYKEIEASKARARLDSALEIVNVPDRIQYQTMEMCSQFMNFRTIRNAREADYVFHIDIEQYGIDAQSWDSTPKFKINTSVILVDQNGSRIWKTKVNERISMSPQIFGLDNNVGNILSGVMLSELSVDEMVAGFEYLSDYTADKITEKLHKAFIKSRSIKD